MNTSTENKCTWAVVGIDPEFCNETLLISPMSTCPPEASAGASSEACWELELSDSLGTSVWGFRLCQFLLSQLQKG